MVPTLLAYARGRNVSKLVIGRSSHSLLSRLLRPSPIDELDAEIDMDVYIVGHRHDETPTETLPRVLNLGREREGAGAVGYVWAAATCLATTLVAAGLLNVFDVANVVMLYLLGVVLVTIRFGRGPGMLLSLLNVVALDLFFVAPRFSFTVADTQYLFTFALMLVVALVISNLTASLRYQALVAGYRERRAEALFDAGKALSSALTAGQIVQDGSARLAGVFQARVLILLPDSRDRLQQPVVEGSGDGLLAEADLGLAQWVYDHQEPAGLGTDTLPANPVLYLPLRAPMRTRGVLAICPADPHAIFQPEQQRLLETFAAQIALALERVHYVEVAQDAVVSMEAERLSNALLAAISHDLRTPLTGLVGLSGTLAALVRSEAGSGDSQTRELAAAIHEEALRLSALVVNLLDMARLQAGGLVLDRQWQPVEEVVGSALRASARVLAGHRVATNLAADLPPVAFDAVLIERVLCNLLDNAAKFTPPGSRIGLAAGVQGNHLEVRVTDDGPGLPEGIEDRLFDKFTRGEKESARPGVGLGLAICRAIVQAHGGRIRAANRPDGGAQFSFTLPLGTPPNLGAPQPELPPEPVPGRVREVGQTLVPEPAPDGREA
ncbi:MAG: DUF4118 domain-containing protein [Thiobacillaceae bacterium]|nr:DUF4118 domain-containing protein [Thiobacillaceae bacterium]